MKNLFSTILFASFFFPVANVLSQVPALSSHPSASAVIFLDVDGHTVESTAWTAASSALFCSPSGLNPAQVTEVFNRVAEDYRPFDVNITTDSALFLNAPFDKRMRVIITTTHDWYPLTGGVAFVGSFQWGDDTPCFVFSAALGYNVKKVAEAAAHEAGHTLGLFHQSVYDANCALVSTYNSGTGTGEIGWAPIMGVGYTRNLTLWNKGPNPYSCDQPQSDLDIITTANGFSYRNDDHPDTFATATNALFSNNRFTIHGIIEQNTDKDLVKFTLPVAGEFQLNAIPYHVGAGNAGSNLDMQITLYNSSQETLNSYNPGSTLNLVVDTLLNEGTYYARIEGKGNQYAPAYASLGSYSLEANFISSGAEPLPIRKLELKGFVNANMHQLDWTIEADEKITAQFIELSTDGKIFTPLFQPGEAARSFTCIPTVPVDALYRIHVSFDNGRDYYSNTISLRRPATSLNKPVLAGNIIYDDNITVKSPALFSYRIVDLNGRNISQGQVKNGTNAIHTTISTRGVYFINFTNGKEQWTEKFIRQ